MGEPQVPQILKKKLVFGDCDQIAALRDFENRCADYYGADGETRWNVSVKVDWPVTIGVTARTQKEAEEKAGLEFDAGDFDVSFRAEKANSNC